QFAEREQLRYEAQAFSVYSGPDNGYTSMKPLWPLPPTKQRQGKAAAVRILTGGALESPGEPVTPGVLSPAADAATWETMPQATHGRRLAFAQWVASPRNPLTARVIVNRVWQAHFGKGLVATPSNFGKMGARPTHPELLDWLAGWFIEQGWSLKKLNRL